MAKTLIDTKKLMRAEMTAKRTALSIADVAALSKKIEDRLFAFEPFMAARTVMFFVSFRSEVRTMPMIERALAMGKKVIVPVVMLDTHDLLPCEITDPATELAPGAWGILEPVENRRKPVDPKSIDFVCTPGLAFDRRGDRLGYGGGYYDRFMRRVRLDATVAALAFSIQIVDSVPAGAGDSSTMFIITDSEIIDCSTG